MDSQTTSEKTGSAGPSALQRIGAALRRVLKGEGGASATLQTLGTQGLMVGVNLATGILAARYLGPDGRGALSAMLVWTGLLGGLLTLGLPSALVYHFHRHPEERRELLGTALALSVIAGLVAAPVGAFFLPNWVGQYPGHIVRAAQLFVLMEVPISLVSLTCVGALKARNEFSIVNGLHFAVPVFTLLVLLALIFTDAMAPVGAAIAYIGAGVLLPLWPLAHLWRHVGPRLRNLKRMSRRLLGYGARSWGIDVLSALATKIDKALVVGILAPKAMGLYVVSLSAAEALRIAQRAVENVLFPKAASRPVREVIAVTGRAVRFNIALTALGAATLLLLGPLLLGFVYGPGFVEAATVLRLLAVEVLFTSTTMVLAQAFMATDRPGVVTATQGLGVAVSLPLLAVLVPLYGLTGAGLALLASGVLRFAAVLACFPLLLGERPPALVLTFGDLRHLRSRFL